jgi:hypothetical protein
VTAKNLSGGCQCGAVRYEWVEKPAYSSVCYSDEWLKDKAAHLVNNQRSA